MYSCPECGCPVETYADAFACHECTWIVRRQVFDLDLANFIYEVNASPSEATLASH
jgi:hypothetical protein